MTRFMKLKRLEFAVTYHCSSKCDHCFVEEETKKKYPGHLGGEGAKIVQAVAELYDLNSVMTFGGEPLLYPETTCAIHRTATDLGIPHRQIITNGLWSKNSERVKEIAKMVVDAGVNQVLISIDAFHAPYVSTDVLRAAALALGDAGLEKIQWNPCWLKSSEDDNKFNMVTKDMLEEVADMGFPVGTGNVISPNGAAKTNLAEFMPPKLCYPDGKCDDQPYADSLDNLQSICIEPNGDLSVCPNFVIGNVLIDDIKELLSDYDPYKVREMKCLLEQGVSGLMNLAAEGGIKLASEGYYTICDMCKDIIGDLRK